VSWTSRLHLFNANICQPNLKFRITCHSHLMAAKVFLKDAGLMFAGCLCIRQLLRA
jgi:hypothetical protein